MSIRSLFTREFNEPASVPAPHTTLHKYEAVQGMVKRGHSISTACATHQFRPTGHQLMTLKGMVADREQANCWY